MHFSISGLNGPQGLYGLDKLGVIDVIFYRIGLEENQVKQIFCSMLIKYLTNSLVVYIKKSGRSRRLSYIVISNKKPPSNCQN